MSKLTCIPVSVALIIVRALESGVKFVSSEPSKAVSKFVFSHMVMLEEVIVFVMRCKFGNQAAKAIITNEIIVVIRRYLGRRIIYAIVVIALL